MYTTVSLSALPLGAKLGSAIRGDGNLKLLGEGVAITPQLLESLRKRGVSSVVVSNSDMGRIQAFKPQGSARTALADRQGVQVAARNDLSEALDSAAAKVPAVIVPSENPFSGRIKRPGAVAYDTDFSSHLAEQNETNVNGVGEMITACAGGAADAIAAAEQMVNSTLGSVTEDLDAFVCLGGNPFATPYPSRHSLHSAMLSTALGSALGLDEPQLKELATGCLIHDIGMLSVDPKLTTSKKQLTPEEFAQVAVHPVKTLELIERYADHLPLGTRMVAYQIHERNNGSGYPRGRTAAEIHPLARIAAVADAYTALVTPRPHRPGMLPYFAVEKLLKDVRDGLLDADVVRALLNTVGLFPIGSYVAVGEEYVGRVIRNNPGSFSKPVVELWKRNALSAFPSVVDLKQEAALDVKRPLMSLMG